MLNTSMLSKHHMTWILGYPVDGSTGRENRLNIVMLSHFGFQDTLELAPLTKITLKEVKNLLLIVLTVQRDNVPSTPFEITHTASSPWQIVHCDFVGPISRTLFG